MRDADDVAPRRLLQRDREEVAVVVEAAVVEDVDDVERGRDLLGREEELRGQPPQADRDERRRAHPAGSSRGGRGSARPSVDRRRCRPKRSSEAWSCRAWNSGVRIMSGVRGRGRSMSMTSLIRPGRALITATWSERKIASEMPWVTISVVAGFSVQIRSSSRLSRWRVMSSRAPNGSSSSSTDGLTTSERAIETRCRMPPESWPGLAFSKPSRPTSVISSLTRASSGLGAGDLEGEPDVGLDASARGAGRSPGRRCRARGRAAARSGSCPRRWRARWSPPRAPRGSAGSWTCRSPTGRAGTGRCPCRCAASPSSRATTSSRPTVKVLLRSWMCRPEPCRRGPRWLRGSAAGVAGSSSQVGQRHS